MEFGHLSSNIRSVVKKNWEDENERVNHPRTENLLTEGKHSNGDYYFTKRSGGLIKKLLASKP